ncbi:MAG: CGGC domain-containing protein [Clostridiales bacterium]|nr:CGGC domain-containing protein [Clostridiales bacterium]
MKVGLIRCLQTEDFCPATTDLAMMRQHGGAFEGIDEDIELIGVSTCGGCPGKRAVLRAREMVRRGADTLAFASCITRGNPIGFPCPFAKAMIRAVSADVGEDIRILDYTH